MSDTPPAYCRATLNYATADGVAPTEVTVHDGRRASNLAWAHNGFERVSHTSAISDWDADTQIEAIHYEEMADLARALSGARAAIVSGHISRNPEQAGNHVDYAPIEYVHSDFTDSYGALVKQRYAQGQDLEVRALARAGVTLEELQQAEHLLILQFWRNVGDPNPDLPLALCDAQTVPRSDLRAFHVPTYAGGDFAFDTFGVQAPAQADAHCWYTFPELDHTEVIAFRTYDSRCIAQDQPFWTPHSAFRNPNAAVNAPARRSIEIRATCLF